MISVLWLYNGMVVLILYFLMIIYMIYKINISRKLFRN